MRTIAADHHPVLEVERRSAGRTVGAGDHAVVSEGAVEVLRP